MWNNEMCQNKNKKIDRVVFYIILAVSLLVRTLFIRHSIGLSCWRDDTILYRLYYYKHNHSLHIVCGPYTKIWLNRAWIYWQSINYYTEQFLIWMEYGADLLAIRTLVNQTETNKPRWLIEPCTYTTASDWAGAIQSLSEILK